MRFPTCFAYAAALFLLTTGGASAQSPTETFLRIQSIRSAPTKPDYVVNHSHLSSRGGCVRSRVMVTAPTPRLARRFAVRRAYARAIDSITVPLRRFNQMTENLADATAEPKATNAIVLSQKKTGSGYRVEVEVRQSALHLAQDIRENGVSNFRIVTLMPETVDGERDTSPKVETALEGALADKQFQVFDWNFVASQQPLNHLAAETLSGRNVGAIELGTHFFANVIIAGRVEAQFSQNNGGITSYVASANLRGIQVDTGRVLFAKAYEEKGFGQDKTQAARQALNTLARTIAQDIPSELAAQTEQYPVTVRLASEPGQEAGQVTSFLQQLPGVTNVQQASAGTGLVFHLTSCEKPAVFGAWIARSKQYRVVGYGPEDH